MKKIQKLAGNGDADCKNLLGALYWHGRVVQQDHSMAFKWFKEASDQGNGQAHVNLGYAYSVGRGVARDYEQAKSKYLEAADAKFDGQPCMFFASYNLWVLNSLAGTAASAGDANLVQVAQRFGFCFHKGQAHEVHPESQNYRAALSYTVSAARAGLSAAVYYLAHFARDDIPLPNKEIPRNLREIPRNLLHQAASHFRRCTLLFAVERRPARAQSPTTMGAMESATATTG